MCVYVYVCMVDNKMIVRLIDFYWVRLKLKIQGILYVPTFFVKDI